MASTYQNVSWFYKFTTEKRTLCKAVAEVHGIRDFLTEGARSKLGSLLYTV